MQLWTEIERLVWHIQISQDEDSSRNQNPALGTSCFKYLFLLQLLKALAWPGDIRSQKKKAGWWKVEDQANVKGSRQKKQTALGFLPSQICPNRATFLRAEDPGCLGQITNPTRAPSCATLNSLYCRENVWEPPLVLWHLTLPPICWARSGPTGARRSPSVPA